MNVKRMMRDKEKVKPKREDFPIGRKFFQLDATKKLY